MVTPPVKAHPSVNFLTMKNSLLPKYDLFRGGTAALKLRMFITSCWLLSLLTAPLTVASDFPSEMSLSLALERAMADHPALKVSQARVSGAAGQQRQAELRPNPLFTLQSENWRFTGEPPFNAGNDLDVFAFFSQPIETAGKRNRRIALTALDRERAELEGEVLRWAIRNRVKLAFLRALSSQKQLELISENSRNFQQIIDYHRIRVEQGAMAEADLIKVWLEGERLTLAENSAAIEAERTRLDLVRAMGAAAPSTPFRLIESPLGPVSVNITTGQQIIELALSKRPEVLLGQSAIQRSQANVGLQQSLARPDWAAIMGYKRNSGFNTLMAGVEVPLPFFNRNQGNVATSRSEVEQSEAALQEILVQIKSDIAAALSGVRRRHGMLVQMEKGMLERADQSLQIALAAYQEGGTDLLRLLDAQRSRNEVRLLYTRTQMDYRISLADLEYAAGEENFALGAEVLRANP